MKILTRALIALVLSLGLTAGATAPMARADTAEPIWKWGNSFNCWTGDTVKQCAYYVVIRLVGFTDAEGCIAEQQAPEYCDRIANDEKEWLWQPITTWDLAQAVLRGYEQVYEEVSNGPDVPGREFSIAFAENLLVGAQARVAKLFDPTTHEYLGTTAFTKVYTPTISGTAKVGKTLTASVRTWSPKASFSYEWLRNGTVISGATGRTYKLAASDAAGTITVRVTGNRSGYTVTAKTSKPTKKVALGTLSKGKVTVTGARRVGMTLTAKTSKWSSGVTYHFKWYRNSKTIAGATAKTYTLTITDKGARFKVKVWTTKDGYKTSATRTSPRTAKVKG
jgi:hypothetical protein